MTAFRIRRLLPALMAVCALTSVASVRADVLYDPPVGSRWIIQRDLTTEVTSHENGKTDVEKSTMKITAELTVIAKTPDGFQITYARRKSSYDGNVGDLIEKRAALDALNNVVMKVSTDRAGKPLRVENVEDVKAAVQKMIDRLAAYQHPSQVAAFRNMLAGMTQIDGVKAAEAYLDELGNLAVGQNTGLKAGEVRHSKESPASPTGTAMVKNISLSMVSTDLDKGDARLVLTESYEPESIRLFLTDLIKRSGGDVATVKDMKLSLDAKADIEVVGGMTRSLERESTTSNHLSTNYRITKSRKTVTVTQAK